MAEKFKIRTNIYLEPDHKAELERISRREHTSVAKLIRHAIAAYLERRKKGGE